VTEIRRKRLKTAEIVVADARRTLRSPRPTPAGGTDGERLAGVRLEPWEDRLRARLQRAGARWDRELGLWRVAYNRALRLGIEERIVSLPQREKAATRRNF
jgi:hypothetical protein